MTFIDGTRVTKRRNYPRDGPSLGGNTSFEPQSVKIAPMFQPERVHFFVDSCTTCGAACDV